MYNKAYIALRGIIRGFATPPYLVILFASAELLVLLIDLLEKPRFQLDILLGVFHFVHIILLISFTWFTGTLPLKTFRPAHNVAKADDVWLLCSVFRR